MANNPYLYPMKYLLFYIISLLSLTACIHEELPPEGGFALEEGDRYPNSAFPIRMERYRKKTWKINLP